MLADDVGRVVVVGGGIAGLTVASALTNAGVDCRVLEARSRIGGRLHTVDMLGVAVDLGGSWIHHPTGNPMTDFADAMGLARHGGDALATIGGYDLQEGRRLDAAEVERLVAVQLEEFPAALDALRRALPDDASAADGIESFIAERSLSAHDERVTRQALQAMVEADAADAVDRQSLRWIWNEFEYDDELFGDLPTGGYRTVVEAMARGVDIRLESEVDRIRVVDDGVQVHCADGIVERASHVVVTVPLGVLKAGSPTFEPALPPAKGAAIDRLGFGRYEKVVLRFERAFWREAGVSHLTVFHPDDTPATWIFDLDAFGDGPALSAHVFHSATGRVLDATHDEAVTWVQAMIAAAVGHPCPQPLDTVVTAWTTDQFTRGAYTHVPPGAHPELLDLLGEPAHERVLFAGEHTQSHRTGYADGALSSGLREARRLLGTDAVRIGRRA